jgi:hypothetical protein
MDIKHKNTGAVVQMNGLVTVNMTDVNIDTQGPTVSKVYIKGGTFERNEAQTASAGVVYGSGTTYITGGTFQNNKRQS